MTFIGEILEATNKLESREEVINHLRKHKSDAIILLFESAYHPLVVWALPEGTPPFKPDPNPYAHQSSNLYVAVKGLFNFLECPKKIANPYKREEIFVNLLERLHKTEAQILLLCKDKALHKGFKWLTYDLVSETFPGMLPPRASLTPLEESKLFVAPLPKPKSRKRGPYGKRNSTKVSKKAST